MIWRTLLGWLGVGSSDNNKDIGDVAKKLRESIVGQEVDLDQAIDSIVKISEAQAKVNAVEAASSNLFVAGWRPFIGWVLGVALAIYFIPQYFVATYIWVTEYINSGEIVEYPVNNDSLLELVTGMLGLAAIRTIDKKVNKQK